MKAVRRQLAKEEMLSIVHGINFGNYHLKIRANICNRVMTPNMLNSVKDC